MSGGEYNGSMPKNVVVLTGGADADHLPALERALEVASPDADLTIFDVVYEPMLEGYMGNREIYEPLRRRVVSERQERAEKHARTAASRGARAAAKAVWDHPVHTAVLQEIGARQADLLVAAPKLQSSGAGLAHSDWQIVVTSPVPTLIVRSSAATPYRRIVAAVDPLHAHAKPAALDAAILSTAKALQRSTGAALTVLHCHAPLEYFGADLSALPAGQGADRRRREAVESLLDEAGIDTAAARIVAGAPDAVLQSMAAKGEADLIVMGVLARGRLKELLIGNTAERVLHHGAADVLVVKPPPR